VELSLPRNHRARLWELDKLRRWKSKPWRTWVRTLIPLPAPGAPATRPGDGFDIVIAAHFRYPGCGIGTRPADCFVYPMHDADHKAAHNAEQPDPELQWLWCLDAIMKGLKRGKLGCGAQCYSWITEICRKATARQADLSTAGLEEFGATWARFFLAEDLWINENEMDGF